MSLLLLVDYSFSVQKLLEKPVVKDILELLVKDVLSISQIIDKLKNDDVQMILAILTELQYFGVITPLKVENKEKYEIQNQHKDVSSADSLINLPSTLDPPLGIPIGDYNTLWKKISESNRNSDLSILKIVNFTLNASFKEKFDDKARNKEK